MVVPSRPMMEVLRRYGVTTHAEIIPTGLEPESFVPGNGDDFRRKYGIALDRPMLLFVGRVAHEKNIGFLLRVADRIRKDIPEVLLLIAGAGPAREGLERETEKLGLSGHVMFIGYLDRHAELNDCYRSADIFVFSSKTETQGLVLLEAMAQSVPVVSIAEMGTLDVLREGCGVWIAEDELANFSGKVIEISFHQNETVTEADINTIQATYLYTNRGLSWFAEAGNPKNRFSFPDEAVHDQVQWLVPNSTVDVLMYEKKPMTIKIPVKVDLEVKDAPPAVKGNTVSGGSKLVEISTRAKINVPLFINTGDIIRINTDTGAYSERVEKA